MAAIAARFDQKVEAPPADASEAPASCAVPLRRWSAIDTDVERKIDVRSSRKLSFREHLFSFLVDYNRH
jgi:hypothetical protein